MNGPFDETLLTAYVLGEVTDEQAREIAARLEQDAEARAFVEAQRELATSLEAALGAEVGPGLDTARRGEVLSGGTAGTNWPLYGLRAAAVIFLCVGLGVGEALKVGFRTVLVDEAFLEHFELEHTDGAEHRVVLAHACSVEELDDTLVGELFEA